MARTPKERDDQDEIDIIGMPKSNNEGIAAGELLEFIEQHEKLDDETKEIAEQKKELMAEAKGRGYDTKVMRAIIKQRAVDADTRAEFESILELYKTALGMS